MRWTVLVDVDIATERLPAIQLLLNDSVEELTGVRPHLKTIRSDHLELALQPLRRFAEKRSFYGR